MIKEYLLSIVKKNNINGFTEFIKGNGRYVVGITNNVDVSWEMLSYQYKTLFNKYHTFTFGGWKCGKIYYLDFGIATDNLENALSIGKQHFQKSIRDNKTFKTIDIKY